MKIVGALAKVMAEVGVVGKSKKSPDLKYNYRGVDDVVAVVQPLFAEHGVVMLSRVVAQARDNFTTARGTTMVSVRLTVEHDFWCSEDGSKVTCVTVGEAMDTSDKASNKAMTAAEKYALTQTLKIPTYEADRDIEEANHQTPTPTAKPRPTPAPASNVVAMPVEVWRQRIAEAQTCAELAELGRRIHREAAPLLKALRPVWSARNTELAAREKAVPQ